jgi:hypothetical protein
VTKLVAENGGQVPPGGSVGSDRPTSQVVWNFPAASTLTWTVHRDGFIVAVTSVAGSGQVRFDNGTPVAIPSAIVTENRMLDYLVAGGFIFGIKIPVMAGMTLVGISSASCAVVLHIAYSQ